MDVTVKVPKGGPPFTIFRDRLFEGLSFLHKYGEDPTIAFLPKPTSPGTNKPPMLASTDFPAVQCHMKLHYFSIPNAFAFSEVKSDRGRKITFSALMGFNVDPALYLHEMVGDLEERHCSFTRKTQQAMDVSNIVVFWGAPQHMCLNDAKKISDSHLIALEKRLMSEDPISFPSAVHSRPFPTYAFVCEQPASFERLAPGEKWTPPPANRRAIHMQCAKDDADRLTRLVAAAKSERVWLDEFGQCFPSEVVTRKSAEDDSENYDAMVNSHMAAIYTYGRSYVPGLLKARENIKVTCLPDAKGVVRTHTVSIRSILLDVDFNGQKVFKCVLRSDGNKRYQVYYKGTCPLTCMFVREYLKCPAAQIYYYLIKRGVTKDEADRVVMKCFNHAQVAQVKMAEYNKTTKLAHVATDEGDMDIIAAARDGGFIDEFANMTPDQVAARKKEQSLVLGRHDPAAYNFERGQDVISIHGGNAGPKLGSGASIGASQYSIVTRGKEGMNLLDDDEDEYTPTTDGTTATGTTVRFAMIDQDGVEQEVLRLPDDTTDHNDIMDLDSVENVEEDDDEDDPDAKLLTHMLWMAAPDDLHRLGCLLDHLELEIVGDAEGMEVATGIAALLTDTMRSTAISEAAGIGMTPLEYIQSLRTSLHQTHGKSVEEDIANEEGKQDDDEYGSDLEYMSLPDLSDTDDDDRVPKITGLPQGSDNNAPSGGADLPAVAGNVHATGNETVTAQTGGIPG